MAPSKPVIAVLHANSKQGTSVVLSLLESDKFIVKAIVRSADSDSASLNAGQLCLNPTEPRALHHTAVL